MVAGKTRKTLLKMPERCIGFSVEWILLLQKSSLFSGSPIEDLEKLVAHARIIDFKKEDPIIQQEEQGTSLFLILNGRAKVVRYTEDGKEIILDTLSVGEHFGEMALFDGLSRSASVVASTSVKVLVVDRPSFIRFLQQCPKTLEHLLKELSLRLRQADRRIEELSSLELAERLKKILADLGKDGGQSSKGGFILKELPTHQDLANMVGASRARVSETLAHLKRVGFIKKLKDSILISSQHTE